MNRRHFFTSIAALAASRSRLVAKGGAVRSGICAFSCHQHWKAAGAGESAAKFHDTPGFFRYARELGFEGVQATLRPDETATARALRTLVDETGGYYEGEVRLPREEGDLPAFEATLKQLGEAGATVVRTVFTGGRRYEIFKSREEFDTFHSRAKRSLELAEPVLARRRMRLAVENHKDHTSGELLSLMQAISSEWIGVLVDTGNNIALLEEPHEVISRLAPFVASVHLKDMAVSPCPEGFQLSEVPLGTGVLDLDRVVSTLAAGRPGLVFNLEMATRDPLFVPCLTDPFYVTFPERREERLGAMLKWVEQHPPKAEPPRISGKTVATVLAEEEENNRLGLKWMRKGLATLVLAIGLSSSTPAAAETWPFFPMDTAVRDLAKLETVRSLGYDGVAWRFEPSEALSTSVAKVKESGLPLIAVYGAATLKMEGIAFRGDLDARFAALAGTGATVWLPVNSPDFSPSDPAGDAVAVPELRRLAVVAAGQGLRVALYPHAGSWIERIQDAMRVADQVDHPNFGVTFNLAHCLRVGDEAKIPELLAKAAPRLFLVTVNGADRNAAGASWERLIRPLGEGDYPLSEVLDELKKVGYTGPVGLQAFGVKLPVEENLQRSIEAWRKLVPGKSP
ncbi:MAG: TIM barrel protein [Verrucomicrobiae bacterium]|nr:TIM barrel protein [Verrucomicrobiae bacterium]